MKTKDLSIQEKLRKEFEDLVTQKPQHFVFGMPSIQWQEGVWYWISTNFVPKEEVERERKNTLKFIKQFKSHNDLHIAKHYSDMDVQEMVNKFVDLILKELQDREI